MASLFFYEKSPEISIFDIQYFKNNKVDFDKTMELLETRKANHGLNKIYNEQGYTEIKLNEKRDILSCEYIFENILGNYTEIKYDEEKQGLVVDRQPYIYYGKCRLIITEEFNIIIKASYSNEESSRSKCLSIFNEKDMEVNPIKLTNEVFQYIRKNYEWKKIKIQRIQNEADSTKSVSYTIDPASDKQSEVDLLYKDSGVFDHITFNLDYKNDKYVIKLYKEKNRISIDESQFNSVEEFDEFAVYLLDLILSIKSGSIKCDDDSKV